MSGVFSGHDFLNHGCETTSTRALDVPFYVVGGDKYHPWFKDRIRVGIGNWLGPDDLIAKALWIVFKSKLGRTLVFILLYSTNFRSLIDVSASMSSGYRIIIRKSSTLILKPAFMPVGQFTCSGNNRPSESDIQISLKFNDRIESRVLWAILKPLVISKGQVNVQVFATSVPLYSAHDFCATKFAWTAQ